MKRKILLFVMVLTMLLSAIVLASTVSAAECTVSSSSTNIAPDATITSSATNDYIRPEMLVDGSEKYGTYTGGGSFTFAYDQDKSLKSVKIGINRQREWYAYISDPTNLGEFTLTDDLKGKYYVSKVRVEFLSATNEVVWDSGEIDTSSVADSIVVESVDAYLARKVVVHIYQAWDQWGNTPVSEVYIYEATGSHNWTLDPDDITTDPTCTEAGEGLYRCTCGETKTGVVAATGHDLSPNYVVNPDDETQHYTLCFSSNCSEPAGTKFNVGEHVYDHECDTTCNLCKETREVEGHAHNSDCDQYCNKCEEPRTTTTPHTFAYSCTPECPYCYEPNPDFQDHTYTSACDDKCNFCESIRTTETDPTYISGHVYNSDCDETCNVENCGYVRTAVDGLIPHTWANDCDEYCNVAECGFKRQPLIAHPFKNKCDEKCDKCNELNPSYVAGHDYDNACDERCNECTLKRSVEDHKYDNPCDFECNECHTQRTVSKHIYGEWITLIPATETSEGIRAHYCNNCQNEEQETLPMVEKTGWEALGGGIKALIIIAPCVVILGCAGIGIYSLVIKPKMELKKRQALEAEKKKAEEDDEEYEDDEDEDSES